MVYKSSLLPVDEPQTGIIQYIFANVYNIPDDKPLLIDALDTSRYITFKQFKNLLLRFAAGLQDVCEFTSNDVLAIYAPNEYNYSIPLFGTVAANGAVTTANPNYNVKELAHQLEQSKAKVLICHECNIDTALAASKQTHIHKENIFVFGDKPIKGIQPFQTALIRQRKANLIDLTYEEAKQKVAYICFSSGTTGTSKGVMTTHSNMTSNMAQFSAVESKFLHPDTDRMICVLPLFHMFGLSVCLHTFFYFGIPLYIFPRFDLVQFCETIERYKVTYIPLVPPIYLQLVEDPVVDKYDLASWKLGLSAAAPLSVSLIKKIKEKFPHMTIKQGYGLTETSPVVTMELSGCTSDGSSGILVPNLLAKLVDENGKEVPQGERGELWVKGPNIMKGYINNPKATAECIDKDGYFHTGDIAYVDKEERFYIVDRIKELIKYKGFQVPPAELEDILLKSPLVADCAVIGIYDHSQATELPCAYVVLGQGIDPSEKVAKEIKKHVADQVVSYKQIRSVRFIDAIPKSNTGKILRRILRDQANAEYMNSQKSKL
ncbi:hypothetical protein G6F37_000718 [Rhizopus arrhizus]|nr:hypothetical protein G6F38_000882 [Rhizopus arrhizus]KAG1163966.1 hypothetical protein G6F37_000718 [Rhizopus arrhizus]